MCFLLTVRLGQFHGLHPDYKQDLCQKRYGNIYKETVVPGLEFVHLFDPRDIEKVYRGDGAQPVRRAFFTLAYYNKKYKKQQGLLTRLVDILKISQIQNTLVKGSHSAF